MKIFISWSGKRSKLMAQILSKKLPVILQHVNPWMSDIDIGAGTRWQAEIASELEKTNFGLICVTNENIDSVWLNFEAGALSKSLSDARVIPLLLDNSLDSLQGPLNQFQAVKPDKSGVLNIIKSINDHSGERKIGTERLEQILAGGPAIDELAEKLGKIKKSTNQAKVRRDQHEILEEVNERLRGFEGGMLKVVRSQNELFERLLRLVERQTSGVWGRNHENALALARHDSDQATGLEPRFGVLSKNKQLGGLMGLPGKLTPNSNEKDSDGDGDY